MLAVGLEPTPRPHPAIQRSKGRRSIEAAVGVDTFGVNSTMMVSARWVSRAGNVTCSLHGTTGSPRRGISRPSMVNGPFCCSLVDGSASPICSADQVDRMRTVTCCVGRTMGRMQCPRGLRETAQDLVSSRGFVRRASPVRDAVEEGRDARFADAASP